MMQLWSGNMKYIKYMVALIVLVFIIFIPFTVSAMDIGLSVQSLSDEEKSAILKQRKFSKIISYTPLAITCFDVRGDHKIIIGADSGDTAIIAVYDDYGTFQYGFETKEYGSFRVMWSGNAIAYYSIRSQLLFKINKDGRIIDMSRVMNTTENSIYDRDILLSKTRTVGNTNYSITNEKMIVDVFSASFNKIIKTDTKGTKIIYDASSNQRKRAIGRWFIFLIFSSIIVSGIIIGTKKHRRQSGAVL